MNIRIPSSWLAFALFLLAAIPNTARAEALLISITRSNTTAHHLCDYKAADICAFPSVGLIWQLVHENGNIYIFSHQSKRHSLRYMGFRSVNSLRSGQTIVFDSNAYTIKMTPMWAVNQLF
ncbi:MAG: hypothetical protein ACR2P7_08235 [bacterium]